jgi:hypothetical protein
VARAWQRQARLAAELGAAAMARELEAAAAARRNAEVRFHLRCGPV